MLNRNKIILGVASLAVVGVVLFLAGKIKESRKFQRLDRIADEGYETAGDILFPLKNQRTKMYRADDKKFTGLGNFDI